MNPYALTLPVSQRFLSVAEQRDLLTAAQDVPVTVTTADDGSERVTYGTTPASESALETLTAAFMPAIEKAARSAKVLDDDDALGTVLAEFLAAVRRYDLTSDVPFSATISVILHRAVSDTDRTSDTITVRENVAARYWRLMHKHAFDVLAAYIECRDTSNGFDPVTFLAVHNALRVKSLEALAAPLSDDDPLQAAAHATHTPSAEAWIVTADLVRWLFEQVGTREETILRLRYGFCDLATENLLYASEKGLHVGDVLSDVQIAEVTGWARSTVSRLGNAALAEMRTAYAASLDVED